MPEDQPQKTLFEKANEVVQMVTIDNMSIDHIKYHYPGQQEWASVSKKAYSVQLKLEQDRNKENEKRVHFSHTTNAEIQGVLKLNKVLSLYALALPISATLAEFKYFSELSKKLPENEQININALEKHNMSPRWRVLQKIGRICQYDAFREFSKIVDAALLCYYRGNYISCFLTLAPVIEGVLLRWMNFNGNGKKPEFNELRKFFRKSAERQPCPYNIQFHNVYSKVCDKILNEHLYKPSDQGDSFGDFNRHVALHQLKSSNFGTRNNCVRLFILLDLMTELYLFEGRFHDPRWDLKQQDIDEEITILANVILDQELSVTAEKRIIK